MEGDIPIRLDIRSFNKYGLPVSPLDVCVGYFAKLCLKCPEDPLNLDTDIEVLSFVLTALLNDYDSIYCLEFDKLLRLLHVRPLLLRILSFQTVTKFLACPVGTIL